MRIVRPFSHLFQLYIVDFIDLNHFSNSGKWGDEEIELLRNAVKRFGEDLKKISGQVKNKSV